MAIIVSSVILRIEDGIPQRIPGNSYGEMYVYNNATPTVIETINTPIAINIQSAGLLNHFTYEAGSTGAITAFSDGTGKVNVASATHGLDTGDIITIRGTTTYNGVWIITKIDDDNFSIPDTWAADDGASDWDQPARLCAGIGAAGIYSTAWQVSVAPVAACALVFMLYKNEVAQTKSTAEREYAINDLAVCTSTCVFEIVEGDCIWLSISSDHTANNLIKHSEFNMRRL